MISRSVVLEKNGAGCHGATATPDLTTVHTTGCDKVMGLDPERRVDVSWDARPDVRRVAGALVNSGIAGTDIVYPFGFSTARWLAERWGDRLTIAWDDVGNVAALDTRLHLFSLWGERPVFD